MGRAWWAPPRGGRRGGRIFALEIGFFLVATAGIAAATSPTLSQVAPDLWLANPAVSPMPPYEGDVVHVTVTVANVGDIAASTAAVELIDLRPNGDIITIGRSSIANPLGPDQSVVLEAPPFFAVGTGEHTLTLRVTDVTPAESNASHGVFSMRMPVLPAEVSPPPPTSSDGLRAEALEALGVGAVLGFLFVVAAIGIAIAFVARRRAAELEPPPPEPRDESPPPLWPP